MKHLAVRLELRDPNYWPPIKEVASEAIFLAGRLNAAVVFDFIGIDLMVGTSDSVRDVEEQLDAKAQVLTGTSHEPTGIDRQGHS